MGKKVKPMVTGEGELTGFVCIEEPSTKFNDAGVYECKVEFRGKAAKDMKAKIDALMSESLEKSGKTKKADPPYEKVGKTLVVKFKRIANITTKAGKKYTFKVDIYDERRQLITEDMHIGARSLVQVAWNPYLWETSLAGAGVRCQLEAVMIKELVEYEMDGDDEDSPFGPAEEDEEETPFGDSEEDQDDADDDGDF